MRLLAWFAASIVVAGCASASQTVPSGQSPAAQSVCCSPAAEDHGEFLGCVYPRGDVWQTSVINGVVDKESNAYIRAVMDGGGSGGFLATVPTYEYVNLADDETPLVTVHPRVGYIVPYSPIPWEASFYIEQLSDAHALVLQTQTCRYYEGYETSYSPSQGLTMFNDAHVDLKRKFKRPATGALSTSSGIPLGMLAVRPEELTAGLIQHALGWNIVSGSLSNSACVSPAGRTECTDGEPYQGPASETPMPWGSHARLKSSFNISNFHRESTIVATAMKTYGLYVYDAGCCNEIVFTNDLNGAPLWTSDDAADLKTITPNDLEIVTPP
jgi:hypothetical protein